MPAEMPQEIAAQALADEIMDRCIDLLRPRSWPERLCALSELHDQLRTDFKDFNTFCEVFPLFVGNLIIELGEDDVSSLEQAHIYANSATAAHREAAGRWLKGQA